MARVLIVGGSDAGISAALRARELDSAVEVTVLLADAYPNFSICGLPYYLSGDVPDWRSLAHRSVEELEHAGIELLLEHRVEEVDATTQTVVTRGGRHRYDRLVVATGAEPVRPPIPGLEHEGVHQLLTIGDARLLDEVLARGPERAVIVGAGYIGLEMAEALRARGLDVTLVEQLPAVLPTVDRELGELVREELQRNGVLVLTDSTVSAIEEHGARLVVLGDHLRKEADVVLVVVGVRPSVELGRAAGIPLGPHCALQVDRRMETALPDVFAAGDCTVTYHRLLETDTYLPLGTTAHKQGRIAGENAAGGDRRYDGSLGTQVVKVFELAIARTGFRDAEATEAGLEPLTIGTAGFDHRAYYPHAHEIAVRLTGERPSGRLLGAQMLGHVDAQVAKRIDIVATALYSGLSVDAINALDLSYTPPFGSPWDVAQTAAQAWEHGRHVTAK
jgi:NADPH-dependent 2,4-dienoyl-CoA reductase/sulfur reductase-like enzyme